MARDRKSSNKPMRAATRSVQAMHRAPHPSDTPTPCVKVMDFNNSNKNNERVGAQFLPSFKIVARLSSANKG